MDLGGPVTSYNPTKSGTFQDAVVDWALYDTLLNFDTTTGKLIPGLAKSWTTTPASATFTLKSGVTCSDGTALTPVMVAASLRYLLNPKTASSILNDVIGPGNTVRVISGPNTVTLTLAKPWPDLIAGLAHPFAGIICPSGLKDPASMQTKSAGTGAFVSSSEVPGSSYTFIRRTDYTWGSRYSSQGSGSLPRKLVLKVVTDDNTRANLIATNALQIGAFASDAWTRFKGGKDGAVTASQQSDTMLVFNETRGHPTASKAIRLAISQAIDRQLLNKVQSSATGQVLGNLSEPDYLCYDASLSSAIPGSDPGAAGKALKGVKIRIIGTNIIGSSGNSYVASALQAAGAQTSLNNMDNEAWAGDLFSGKNDWDVTILVLSNILSSPVFAGGFFVGPPPPGGENLGAVDNPAAIAAFTTATRSAGAAECGALDGFQKALLSDSDVLPLGTVPVHVVFAGGTSGGVFKGFVIPATIRVR